MKEKLRDFANSIGLKTFGVCEPEPGIQALVFLFPYFSDTHTGKISLYAQGQDYHKVSRKYMSEICVFLKELTGKDFSDKIYCDITPYNDKEFARLAGLGFYGKNSLLINPTYGSFFFIGYILTQGLSLENDTPLEQQCAGCNACINICPGNAISESGVCIPKCASEISQKKADLSPTEEEILLKSGYIWGCDLCQLVCPHNKNITGFALPEFSQNPLTDLSEEDLSPLSEKQFRNLFSDRAFTWRGKKTLLRNIQLYKNKWR